MGDARAIHVDLGLGRLIRVFAVLSVVFVAALAVAPARSRFTEWRAAQERYNAAARGAGLPAMDPAIQQTWNRTLGVVDRCTSCHVGMGPAEPLAAGGPGEAAALFRAHPPIPHDPAEIGCTLCHGGQGRATKEAAAHGRVAHWFEPLLERREVEAGCGTCHSAIPVGAPDLAARGRALLERYDCLACHRIDGRGGASIAGAEAPDLSGAGLRRIDPAWHERHLERRAADPAGPFGTAYGPLAPDEVAAIAEHLRTLVSAPRLAEGKRLFHVRGCRGCHKVGGVGGEDGPELTEVGRARSYDWQVQHLLSPASVIPESAMPDLSLTRAEAESIALYLRSLRKVEVAAAWWPPDRLRAERLGEREFGTDGRSLFQVFCAACHGPDGEGRRYGELAQAFPAVTNRDFLAVASDVFIEKTVAAGRPGRRMPAWGAMESGLRPAEVDEIVRWLRSTEPRPPSFDEVMSRAPDLERGRRTYERECAACHGRDGAGTPIARGLAVPELQRIADERYLYETIVSGRPDTAMPAFRGELDAAALRSLIAAIKRWQRDPPFETRRALPRASAAAGAEHYAEWCADCHGPKGEGARGAGLANRGFQAAAPDGFIAGAVMIGCGEMYMEPIPDLEPNLPELIAYIRSLEPVPREALRSAWKAKGDPGRGAVLYARACAGCHGAKGEGKEAPALANPAFLAAATDGYLVATIVRGRRGTAMPRFDRDQPGFPRLSAEEVVDVAAFVRGFERR